MKWTSELPKAPGYYWVREKISASANPRDDSWVWSQAEVVLCFEDCQDDPVVQKIGEEEFETLESWEENADAQWWGPIEEPKDDEIRPDPKNGGAVPEAKG